MAEIFDVFRIESVINFAAESHVDNSIKDCMPFVSTNIIGTINLLELSVKHGVKRFVQISTDEVFGSIDSGTFTEQSQIQPRNPYSASKASAEHFVNAFANTYKLDTIIINSSNNYGPHQHDEKLIPLTIKRLLNGEKVPLYGNGMQVRDWLFVEDSCKAILKIVEEGKTGERYCIGGGDEITNQKLVKTIIDLMGCSWDSVEFILDRPGHDVRYATSIRKVVNELGWVPSTSLVDGLTKTIQWVKDNEDRV